MPWNLGRFTKVRALRRHTDSLGALQNGQSPWNFPLPLFCGPSMRQLIAIFLSAGLLPLSISAGTADETREVRYSGILSQANKAGEAMSLRKFEALILTNGERTFFSVIDEDQDGSPWPESYGQLGSQSGPRPHLVYKYDGNANTLPLPPLMLDLPENIQIGSSWTAGNWSFEVVDTERTDADTIWKIDAKERRGRRQKLQVASGSGLLLSAKLDVFMGQGEQFELSVTQMSSEKLPTAMQQETQQLTSDLLSLQSTLARRPDTQQTELSPRQVKDAKEQIVSLTALAKGTPLQETVLRISRDIARQSRRTEESMKRQEQLLNKSAPGFVLNLVTKGVLESDSLKGKTVVLHFWKYAEKPLSEPYGQVGYLEFLYKNRQSMNVEVVGIAMNPSLQQKEQSRSALRSARKLTEFMNLTYPIGYDDGSLLRAFGDPRDTGGQLPLWVVISPAGKVVHYHSGFYEVDARAGLKKLDAAILEQASAAR